MGPSHGAEAHQRGTSPGIWVRAPQLGSVGNRKGEQEGQRTLSWGSGGCERPGGNFRLIKGGSSILHEGEKRTQDRADELPGFPVLVCLSQGAQLWCSINFLALSFSTCKMEIVTIPASSGLS